MANIRLLNKDKYKLSNNRFRELYRFCLKYEEWRRKLKDMRNPLKGAQYLGMPSSGGISNPTESRAIEAAELSEKCALIEQTAKAADPELHKYILEGVTKSCATFKYLKMRKGMPCGRDRYYDRRQKFYYLLDKALQDKEQREGSEGNNAIYSKINQN